MQARRQLADPVIDLLAIEHQMDGDGRMRDHQRVEQDGHGATTFTVEYAVPVAPKRRSQNGRYISIPRAASIPPRSRMSPEGQPKSSRRPLTTSFASSSSPATKIVCDPGTIDGSTITLAFTVFRDLTTRASGNARWICSPRLSVLQTVRIGGMPPEKSSGFETSSRTLPARFSASAEASTSRDAEPAVAFTTSSPNAAACPKSPSAASCPASSAQATAVSFPDLREPIMISWPRLTSFVARARPTTPV